uniref:Small ribosomal subunit protein bS18c n=1 Tax=Selaginella sanguinolenta TaxID=493175 RepID=A0A482CJ46_9TRAC|nr:ribosomal protein S18 [Selaginella sanguinolenta]QBL76352.1 ribosomal protein S18 [Selaginella sanguinolenta]
MNESKLSSRRRLPLIGSGETVDHKNMSLPRRSISKRGKILSKQTNRSTSKQQRLMTTAVKRARISAPSPLVNNETR